MIGVAPKARTWPVPAGRAPRVGSEAHRPREGLERDMTQGQLAMEVEVSRQTINAIEKGKFDPSLPLAFRIARLFGLSIEDVFQEEETKNRSTR